MDKAKTLKLLKEHQRSWAASRGIRVAPNGRVETLDDNFFAPLHPESKKEIREGDGDEFGTPEAVGKLYSLWSSSALACNVFDYWRERTLASLLMALCAPDSDYGQPRFEQKFSTGVRNAQANLDVVFRATGSAGLPIAVESKFTEPYHPGEKGWLRPSYFQEPHTWDTLPLCRAAAESLTGSKRFECLDAGQLLKHILALTRTFGQGRFILLYLWYEVESSDASDQHRAEVVEFGRLVSTEVQFRPETYQQFFGRLATNEGRTPYETYLGLRYFDQA